MADRITISQTTALRLSDAAGVQALDPALWDAVSAGRLSLSELQEAIQHDARRDVDILNALIRHIESHLRIAPLHGLGLDPRLVFAGYALLPRGSRKHLFASAGAVIAIEEVLLRALASPDFFHFDALFDPTDDARTRAPFHVLDAEVEGPARFADYSWVQALSPTDQRTALLSSMPLAP
jgi:hypothetical protein